MTFIGSYPESKIIDHKISKLTKPFYFESDVLKALGLKYKNLIPTGFETDWESVPLLKGTSKIGGLIHDFLSRLDSVSGVTKKIAADVYKEFLIFRGASWWRWRLKYWGVRIWPGYFHKLKVADPFKR